MAHIERNARWYHPWPLTGVNLATNRQLRTIRWNTEDISGLVNSTLLDIDDSKPYFQSNKVLRGTEYGRLEFRNKFRFWYDDSGSDNFFKLQLNTGSVGSPNWIDVFQVEEVLGQVTFGAGGARSIGGWYYGLGYGSS